MLALRYIGTSHLQSGLPSLIPLQFEPGGNVTVGRAADNDVKLFSARLPEAVRNSISRYHAHLFLDASGAVMLRDLGGSNGTYLGGTRLRPQEAAPWRVGEEVVFGGNSGVDAGERQEEWAARGRQLALARLTF